MPETLPPGPTRTLPWTLVLLMAVASGAVVANLYYNQPLLAEIARDLDISGARVGLVPTFTQVGYGLGLLFIAPVGDRAERRRLIVTMVVLAAVALAGTMAVGSASTLFAASLLVGLFSVVPQILVPLIATISEPEKRSQNVGTVMSGLLIGVLLARTVSGFVGSYLGWRAVYLGATVLMLLLAALLRMALPENRPAARPDYFELLTSLPGLLKRLPPLQEAAVTGALLFAAFSVFWTTLVFRLEAAPYHLGAKAAGFFGLAGAAGALAATLSGRFADRLGSVRIVLAGLGLVLLSWALLLAGDGSLVLLAVGAVLLDFGIQGAHVANQARILVLIPEARNRINTVYIVSFFVGGALGSMAGAFAWNRGGWNAVCSLGMGLMVVALAAQGILAGRRHRDSKVPKPEPA